MPADTNWKRFYCSRCRQQGGDGREVIVESANVRNASLRAEIQQEGPIARRGHLERCKSVDQAKVRGERAAEHSAGVVVFSVTGEPEFGEFEPPVVVAKYGEIPAEFR